MWVSKFWLLEESYVWPCRYVLNVAEGGGNKNICRSTLIRKLEYFKIATPFVDTPKDRTSIVIFKDTKNDRQERVDTAYMRDGWQRRKS